MCPLCTGQNSKMIWKETWLQSLLTNIKISSFFLTHSVLNLKNTQMNSKQLDEKRIKSQGIVLLRIVSYSAQKFVAYLPLYRAVSVVHKERPLIAALATIVVLCSHSLEAMI